MPQVQAQCAISASPAGSIARVETRESSPLRILAPAALVVFALALLLVIVTSGGGDDPQPTASKKADKARDLGAPRKQATTSTTETAESAPSPTSKASYVVKTGDTLGSIAEKTGVPVSKLQELNPELDPQALVSGQKIRLRE